MTTPCAACPLRPLPVFKTMSPEEVAATQKFKSGEITVAAGTTILEEGSSSPHLFTALAGIGLRTKSLPDGRRQVLNLIFPGDLVGLQSGLIGEMKHSVTAATPMTLCVFDRSSLWRFFHEHPERGYDLVWLAAVEEHFLGESLTSLGQRSALERMAWALLRIWRKASGLGLAVDRQCPLPIRQQDLADALGLSLVHTNKTLAKLRMRQLANWSDGVLHIDDPEGLAELAMVDLSAPGMRRPLL